MPLISDNSQKTKLNKLNINIKTKYIVGNKIDKDNERIITKEQAMQLCNKKNAKYYECSALTKENIFELVYLFFLDYLNQEENQKKKQKINFIPSLTRDDTNNKTDCIIY